ncbi:MAG: alpha-amylase family glycosyl hydrolase [Candidatus Woesearchaeota archaeon]
MEQKLLDQTLIEHFYPEPGVVKRTDDEELVVSCKFRDDNDLVVEVWSNILGRPHGFLMNKKNGVYTKKFSLKTGFYEVRIRWRYKDQKFWHWLDKTEVHVDPSYIKKSVFYNSFIRFYGHKKIDEEGKISFGDSGTFDDLKHRLKEIKDMGCDVLYLNPIHPIGELYRNYNPHDHYPNYLQPGCPYSIKDYKAIDPELGIDKDGGSYTSLSNPLKEFKEMVKEAHRLNIKVFMDLVFNHTSHDFVFQRLHPEWFLYKENITSLEDPYIYPEEIKDGKPWGDPKHTFSPFDHGTWWRDAAQINWEYMIPKASNEPPKNPTIKEMYTYFKSIPKYWIKEIGIDGFRCDVAYRIPPKFWKECIGESRELAKKLNNNLSGDVVFIAESFTDNIKELFEAGFSAVYGDFSNKLYSPLSLKGYVDYMLTGVVDKGLFFLFSECHDFHRTTKKLTQSREEILGERANKSRYMLTATIPGIPMIFNGFEKIEWQQVNLFSYSSIDWESDKDLKKYISKINNIRNKSLALQKGSYKYIYNNQPLEQSQVFAFIREYKKEKILVCVNMDIYHKAHTTLYLDETFDEYVLKDKINGEKYERRGRELYIELEPGESHIFEIK